MTQNEKFKNLLNQGKGFYVSKLKELGLANQLSSNVSDNIEDIIESGWREDGAFAIELFSSWGAGRKTFSEEPYYAFKTLFERTFGDKDFKFELTQSLRDYHTGEFFGEITEGTHIKVDMSKYKEINKIRTEHSNIDAIIEVNLTFEGTEYELFFPDGVYVGILIDELNDILSKTTIKERWHPLPSLDEYLHFTIIRPQYFQIIIDNGLIPDQSYCNIQISKNFGPF